MVCGELTNFRITPDLFSAGRTRSRLVSVIALALMFVALSANAQDLSELPTDVPPLPEAQETDRPLYISARNASLFHELLLAPVAQWFKEGKFVARVVKTLPYNFRLAQTTVEQTRKNGEQNALVDGLPKNIPAVGSLALPFGAAAQVNLEPDSMRRAKLILWNIEFMQLVGRNALYSFDYGWFSGQRRQRTASGVYYSELYPTVAVPANAAANVFRGDVLHFSAPAVVSGFTQISHRRMASPEDRVWIYSPVIGKAREVVDPNRGDPVLGGLLSFDDFLVSSTNLNALSANVVEERIMLVPFPTIETVKFVREPWAEPHVVAKAPAAAEPDTSIENVLTVRGPFRNRHGASSFVTWNADTAEHPQGAAWIPTSSLFVPRKVWILELTKSDPYYLLGRQILVVDQELQLPVYKIVYDRKGDYLRTLAAGWTLGVDDGGNFRTPILGFLLSVDRRLTAAAALTTNSFQTLEPTAQPKAYAQMSALLDINSQVAQHAEPTPTSTPTPATPAPVESDPVD